MTERNKFIINPKVIAGKDPFSAFARGIQRVFGIEQKPESKPVEKSPTLSK